MFDIPERPDIDDKEVERLLQIMTSDLELVVLKVQPEKGAMFSDCTEVVRKKVEESGGRIIYGWQIWKSNFIIEAEFHAVWESPDNVLVVITPKPYGIHEILFLEDEDLVYEGKQIDNIRLNISNNKLVDHFIETHKAIYRLMNRGDRAYLHDEEFDQSLTDDEREEIVSHQNLRDALGMALNNGMTENSECFFCESSRKYKNCCGQNFIQKIRLVK